MATRFKIFTEFKGVDKVSKPVKKMQARLKVMGKQFLSVTKKMTAGAKKVGKVLAIGIGAGVATATAALYALKAQVEAVTGPADKLAKTARRLDFDIEALQEWSFVAEQSGLSTEGLYKNLDGLNKRMGELKGGTGSLKTILEKLNPTLLSQLKNAKDSAQGFDLLINAIGSETDVTKKAAIATAAFGRSGLEMINITHNSAEAIKNMREQMRQNGVLTQEEAENAEVYNDAWNNLKKTMNGFRASVITPLLPMLTQLVDSMRNWVLENKGLVFDKIKDGLEWISKNWDSIKQWAKWIGIAVLAVGGLVAAIITIGAAITAVVAAFPGIVIALKVMLVGAAVWAVAKIVEAFSLVGGIISGYFNAAVIGVKNIWLGIVIWIEQSVNSLTQKISEIWEKIKSFGGGVLGKFISKIGFDNSEPSPSGAVVSPNARTASMIEQRTTNSAEVTIKDESGKAEVTKGGNFKGFNFQPSGAF